MSDWYEQLKSNKPVQKAPVKLPDVSMPVPSAESIHSKADLPVRQGQFPWEQKSNEMLPAIGQQQDQFSRVNLLNRLLEHRRRMAEEAQQNPTATWGQPKWMQTDEGVYNEVAQMEQDKEEIKDWTDYRSDSLAPVRATMGGVQKIAEVMDRPDRALHSVIANWAERVRGMEPKHKDTLDALIGGAYSDEWKDTVSGQDLWRLLTSSKEYIDNPDKRTELSMIGNLGPALDMVAGFALDVGLSPWQLLSVLSRTSKGAGKVAKAASESPLGHGAAARALSRGQYAPIPGLASDEMLQRVAKDGMTPVTEAPLAKSLVEQAKAGDWAPITFRGKPLGSGRVGQWIRDKVPGAKRIIGEKGITGESTIAPVLDWLETPKVKAAIEGSYTTGHAAADDIAKAYRRGVHGEGMLADKKVLDWAYDLRKGADKSRMSYQDFVEEVARHEKKGYVSRNALAKKAWDDYSEMVEFLRAREAKAGVKTPMLADDALNYFHRTQTPEFKEWWKEHASDIIDRIDSGDLPRGPLSKNITSQSSRIAPKGVTSLEMNRYFEGLGAPPMFELDPVVSLRRRIDDAIHAGMKEEFLDEFNQRVLKPGRFDAPMGPHQKGQGFGQIELPRPDGDTVRAVVPEAKIVEWDDAIEQLNKAMKRQGTFNAEQSAIPNIGPDYAKGRDFKPLGGEVPVKTMGETPSSLGKLDDWARGGADVPRREIIGDTDYILDPLRERRAAGATVDTIDTSGLKNVEMPEVGEEFWTKGDLAEAGAAKNVRKRMTKVIEDTRAVPHEVEPLVVETAEKNAKAMNDWLNRLAEKEGFIEGASKKAKGNPMMSRLLEMPDDEIVDAAIKMNEEKFAKYLGGKELYDDAAESIGTVAKNASDPNVITFDDIMTRSKPKRGIFTRKVKSAAREAAMIDLADDMIASGEKEGWLYTAKPPEKGWVRLNMKHPKLNGKWAPKGVAEHIKTMVDGEKLGFVEGALRQYYDVFHGYQKSQALWALGYHTRNIGGADIDAYFHMSEYGKLRPTTLYRGKAAMMQNGMPIKLKAGGRVIDSNEVMEKLTRMGVFDSGEASTMEMMRRADANPNFLGKAIRYLWEGKYSPNEINRVIAQATENNNKLMQALIALDNGASIEEAGAKALFYNLDYGDLSKAGATIGRRAQMFWTFWRKKMPQSFQMMAKHPSVFGNMAAFTRGIEDTVNVMRDSGYWGEGTNIEEIEDQVKSKYQRLGWDIKVRHNKKTGRQEFLVLESWLPAMQADFVLNSLFNGAHAIANVIHPDDPWAAQEYAKDAAWSIAEQGIGGSPILFRLMFEVGAEYDYYFDAKIPKTRKILGMTFGEGQPWYRGQAAGQLLRSFRAANELSRLGPRPSAAIAALFGYTAGAALGGQGGAVVGGLLGGFAGSAISDYRQESPIFGSTTSRSLLGDEYNYRHHPGEGWLLEQAGLKTLKSERAKQFDYGMNRLRQEKAEIDGNINKRKREIRRAIENDYGSMPPSLREQLYQERVKSDKALGGLYSQSRLKELRFNWLKENEFKKTEKETRFPWDKK
jgi:hypothetical protein